MLRKRKENDMKSNILEQEQLITKDADQAYWLNKLSGDIEFSTFPQDLGNSEGDQTECMTISIPKEVSDKINRISNHSTWGNFLILVTALQVLLKKYTRNNDILIGTTSLKNGPDDLLLLRNTVSSEMALKELLLQVKKNVNEAVKHHKVDLLSVLSSMDILQSKENDIIFPVLVDFENLSKRKTFTSIKAKLSFNFSQDEANQISGEITYRTVYSYEFIRNLERQLVTALEQFTANPEGRIGSLDLLTETEKKKLLHEFNQTTVNFEDKKLLHQLVEEQVQRSPNRVAITFGERQITYLELNKIANQLGLVLREKGVSANTLVGLVVRPGIEMAIALLAIMKAGGAYIPINPNYPTERKNAIIEDSELDLILNETNDKSKLDLNGDIIDLNTIQSIKIDNLPIINGDEDLAYCIYTSGTTGKPKGVMVQHRAIANNILWRKKEYQLSGKDNVLQLFSFSFDGFVTSFFTPLVSGAQLVLVQDDDLKNLPHLYNIIKSEAITHFISTPSLFNSLLEEMESEKQLSIRIITLAGEEVTSELLKKSSEKLKDVEIANEYGPTENSVVTTISRNLTVDSKITIGKPIANNQVYILDDDQNLQPIGVPGEVYISGVSLAKGYVNNPSLTKEKMVSNPFVSNAIMYKTGDLARWLADGSIEFLGRVDEQVKIRGFRIELKEIEEHLKQQDLIKDVVAIAKNDTMESHFICAYYIASEEVPRLTLRSFLENRLPDFMIPTYFIRVDYFPLTINGKIDKSALPNPQDLLMEESNYQVPRSKTEEKLVTIWSQILDLEKGKIGIADNLFDLGVHSLKIASFVSKVYREFEVSIPIHIIFQLSTVEEQSAYISQVKKEKIYAIEKEEEGKAYYPLSSAQKRIYMLQTINNDQISYNMPKALIIEGPLDVERVRAAFNKLLERHEALRTGFIVRDGNPAQKIHNDRSIDIEWITLNNEVVRESVTAFIQPFDLSKDPLIRIKIAQLVKHKHLLLIDLHHIISDGQSVQILISEFVQLYEGRKLPDLNLQYKDYSAWQNRFLQFEELKQQEHYWINRISEEYPVLQLPTDFTRPSIKGSIGKGFSIHVENELVGMLKKLAAKEGVTLFMLLLAAYNVVLSKYANQEDIIVGTPISGRNHPDVEGLIGMFVNTLALRNYPKKEKTFVEFLREVRQTTLEAFENQDYPFELLVNKLNVQRDTSRNPIFDTMFAFQESSYSQVVIEGLKIDSVDMESNTSKFDLSLYMTQMEDGLEAHFEFSTDLFKKETIERLSQHYLSILEAIVTSPEDKLKDIRMIGKEEKKLLLHDFNQTEIEFEHDLLLHEFFELQAAQTPDKIALQFADRTMSYQELNEHANQLAHKLRGYGVKDEILVSVVMERSFEMVKSILAILKAGGAYVPIDPNQPEKRIEGIIKDSNSALVLTQDQFNEKIASFHENIFVVDDQKNNNDTDTITNLDRNSHLENLAYVIYTSGSTGKPKGVMIEHRQVLNTLCGLQRRFPMADTDAYLLKTPYSFDVSVTEVFSWILAGARLVILEPEMEKDPMEMCQIIKKQKVTHVNFVPSLFQAFIDIIPKKELAELTNLSYVFVAGEALSSKLANRGRTLLPHTQLYNLYGPTEGSIYTTGYSINNHSETARLPIGVPLDNVEVLVLNDEHDLQPLGIPGELCIAGKGVARGYLNDEVRTKEKFIPHPYRENGVIYKSGDLVRWLPDGNIEYLGRKDYQIKIRGYRIEIGEIEYNLMQREGVRDVVVIDREDAAGNKYLCAYIVAENCWTHNEWHHFMREKLPDYMIPRQFIHLDKMPLSPNGKLDRKALSEEEAFLSQGEHAAPKNKIEEQLVEIWSEVLGMQPKKIGVTDNFFELGGDSISILNAITKMYFKGWSLTVKDFYMTPTIRWLAEKVAKTYPSTNEAALLEKPQFISPSNRQLLPTGKVKAIQNILVTGATGFLGIHMIKELLEDINASIYCLVRGPVAEDYFYQKLAFYFNDSIMKSDNIKNRIHIITGDVTKENLGMDKADYIRVSQTVDTVIHAAAIVKHYGNEADFNFVNVIGTEKVIDFCFSNDITLHFISTISLSGSRSMDQQQTLFTENHLYIKQDIFNNVYLKSKFEAESRIYKAQKEKGLQASVYRVGNLTGRFTDGVFQENIEENAFYQKMKFLLDYKAIPETLLNQVIEFTPVDVCSKAIIKILQTEQSSGNVFHLFNHKQLTTADLLTVLESLGIQVTVLEAEKFQAFINQLYESNGHNASLSSIITELVEEDSEQYQWRIHVDSTFTRDYLQCLDTFDYPTIESNYMKKLLQYMKDVHYLKV